jgi:hypothetical protein
MPAVSKAQQHFMGMVHAYQRGELDLSKFPKDVADHIRHTAKTMTQKASKKYASTKLKNLPDYVRMEDVKTMTFKQFLSEVAKQPSNN